MAAARATDISLLFSESALEVNTIGTLAPIITAADTEPPKKLRALYRIFPLLISGTSKTAYVPLQSQGSLVLFVSGCV